MYNIKLKHKLISTTLLTVGILAVICFICFSQINNLSKELNNIGKNRIPDINDLTLFNNERMKIRAQTLEVLTYEQQINQKEGISKILEQRKNSWQIIDKYYELFVSRPRQSEKGKQLVTQAKNEYKAWRDIYIKLDLLLANLTSTSNPAEMNLLFKDYRELIAVMVPISDKLGSTFQEINMNNINNTQDIVNSNISEGNKSVIMVIIISIIGVIISVAFSYLITLNVLREVGGEPAEVARIANEVANGNLTIKIQNAENLTGIFAAITVMTEKLKEIISHVISGANNIASATEQMSSTSQELSQGASEQASSVEEVSSSMEQMASNIQQNTDNAQQTDKIATSASYSIAKVSKASEESSTSIKNIADKILIINDIAFQTNILALNAAVEAAIAGEHGRGFAVVAAEVRKLAERSKVAADEINVLAKNSVKVTEESAQLLNQIIPEIEKTAKLVQEISAASIEQTSGADQINNAIQQLNTITQQNAAASEELATSAEEMASQAEQLREIISYFSVGDDKNRIKIQNVNKPFKKPLVAEKLFKPKANLIDMVSDEQFNTF